MEGEGTKQNVRHTLIFVLGQDFLKHTHHATQQNCAAAQAATISGYRDVRITSRKKIGRPPKESVSIRVRARAPQSLLVPLHRLPPFGSMMPVPVGETDNKSTIVVHI